MRSGQLMSPYMLEEKSPLPSNPWTSDAPQWSPVGRVDGWSRVQGDKILVSVWYDSRITTDHRLVKDGIKYDIIDVNNVDDRNRELELTVKESI